MWVRCLIAPSFAPPKNIIKLLGTGKATTHRPITIVH